MALQFSVSVRNARLDSIESTIGNVSSTLKIFSGSEPANCAAADPTGLLATIALPNPFMSAASAGVKSQAGSWSTTASAAGIAASFRMYDSGGVCHAQGSVSMSGGGGDMIIDNSNLASAQPVNVTAFALTDPNG